MTAIKGKEISIFTFSMMWPLPVWLPAWQLSEFKGFPVAYSWNTNQIVENYFDFFPVVRGNSVCQKQRWPAMLFFQSLSRVCCLWNQHGNRAKYLKQPALLRLTGLCQSQRQDQEPDSRICLLLHRVTHNDRHSSISASSLLPRCIISSLVNLSSKYMHAQCVTMCLLQK